PLDRVEHRRRTDRTVDPDDRRAALLERRGELLRRGAVERIAVLFGGHLRDDRQIRDAAPGVDRRADLVEVAERLEGEQNDAAGRERPGLLREVLPRLVDAGLAPGLDANSERTDRSGDVRPIVGGVSRDPRALLVDRVQLVGEAERSELDPVRAK